MTSTPTASAGLTLATLARELENAANLQATNVALVHKVMALQKSLDEVEAGDLKLQIKILRTELANEKKEKAELAEIVEDIYASIKQSGLV